MTMKLSLRGSLRKSCNVIQIAIMTRTLLKKGLTDFGSFVRKWNTRSGKSHQIVGKRAIALKLLFESTPEVCLQKILDHVGNVGWSAAVWSDDNLSTKKFYPRFQFPS